MKRMRVVALVLTLVLFSSLFSFSPSFSAPKKLKIGVAIPSADHGWTGGVVWWAKKAISDWQGKDKNIEFYLVTSESASQQVGQVEDLMVKGIDALVILAHDSAPLTPVVEQAKKKGIYIEILDSQPAYWSTQKGLEVMENYLQKYKQIDAVWTGDDDVLKGVLQAYKESGRKDIKLFVGGGGSKDIVKMIMDGDPVVRATATYPPSMIATGISLAVMGLRGQHLTGFYQRQVPSKIILAAELIVKGNAKYYYEPDSIY